MIKGKYVAQVIVDFEFEQKGWIPLGVMRENIIGDAFTNAIKAVIEENILTFPATLQVEKMYADLVEVEHE